MTPEDERPATAQPARPDEARESVRAGPRLIAAGLAMVAGITALVIAILLVRGVLL